MRTGWNTKATALLLAVGLVWSIETVGQDVPYYEAKTFAVGMYPANEPSKLWVNIERRQLTTNPVSVALYDDRGKELFKEWLPKRDVRFHQRFDFSEIGDGTYTFVISDGIQTQKQIMRLSTPGFEEQQPKRLITLREVKPATASTTPIRPTNGVM